VRALAAVGRAALFAEGELWRTLLALLFADLMFLPVEGQLPVPFLSGPLDFGTPAFASRRRAEVDAVWREIEAGGAAARVASAWDRWAGVRLRGARWEVADREVMCAVAAAMPGAALRRVLEPLLHGGSRAARGLPDLVVLPGALAQLPDALPSVIRPSLLLVELKTEHDQLRDEQAVWHDRLIEAGVRVELWEVTTRPG
jgi:hypothetical protein